MSRLTRDGTAGPASRDQILTHERGQGNIHCLSSADHEQDLATLPGCSSLLLYMMIIHTYSGIYVVAIYIYSLGDIYITEKRIKKNDYGEGCTVRTARGDKASLRWVAINGAHFPYKNRKPHLY